MNKSGVKVGCPTGEKIIVPVEVTDLYAPNPENWKSMTVFETIHADGQTPSFFCGMSWYQNHGYLDS